MKNSKIHITRNNDLFGIYRTLKVYIDESHVGGVKWDKSTDFSISPGKHKLVVKMDWCKSEPLEFEVGENELLEYQVSGPAEKFFPGIFTQLFDLVFNFSNFFKLKRVDT